MSIASQLTAYENGLTDSYNMVSQKGGTMPVHKNMSSLASSIATIPSGGGGFTFALPLKADGSGFLSAGSSTSFTLTSPPEVTSLPTDTSRSKQFAYAFYNCSGLTKVDLSSITGTVTSGSIQYLFANCPDLEEVNLSGITQIGTNSGASVLGYWFYRCPKLTKVDLSNVTSIRKGGLNQTFADCTSLASVSFDSLINVQYNGFMSTFSGCTSLARLDFPVLNQTNYGESLQFTGMLSGCSNVTVHFPASQRTILSNWNVVQNGFGGTNTTVLYDL